MSYLVDGASRGSGPGLRFVGKKDLAAASGPWRKMRICFTLRVRANRVEEYKKRHARVWPEMLDALRETGWRNYSLFLRADGLLIGYLEAEDFNKCCAEMKKHPVNAKWQAEMAPLFEAISDRSADDHMFPLEEVFHLD
jgi:L-rhamnose mutarotase